MYMRYIALLRGINVGGNSMVKMSDLKNVFEKEGFSNVSTFINSGNVIFESDKTDSNQLRKDIETLLSHNFFEIKTVLLSQIELETVVKQIPKSWKTEDLRKYIAFVRSPTIPTDVIKETQPKERTDFIEVGKGVVYMSTKMEGLTKSSFPKLITKKIYQDITIRNFTTVQKLLALLENT